MFGIGLERVFMVKDWSSLVVAHSREIKVGGGIVRARVVSSVVIKVVLMELRGCEVFVEWFWMGDDSLDEMSMKSVCGIFLGGFWVEELALEAMRNGDQGWESPVPLSPRGPALLQKEPAAAVKNQNFYFSSSDLKSRPIPVFSLHF
ncbi:hypothetical protein Tco_0527824 [Tanacetum coccineum]